MNLSEPHLQCLRDGVLATIHQRPLDVWVVGSFARGEEVRSSDLDLMLRGPGALSLAETAQLRAWFDASSLPYVIDMVDYHQVSQDRLAGLLRGAQNILSIITAP